MHGVTQVCAAEATTFRGNLDDAVWELLAAIHPEDCAPRDIAAMLDVLCVAFGDRFGTQDNLPPTWQTYGPLVHRVLEAPNAAKPHVLFCASHVNDHGTTGGTALHHLVQHAAGREPRAIWKLIEGGCHVAWRVMGHAMSFAARKML